MGSKYTSQSISGYNSSAPADDGTQTDSNKVKWSTIKNKLADPVKTLAESMNTALVTALDTSTRSITGNDSAIASDNGKAIEVASTVTSALTITLSDAATMGAGYTVSVFNSGSGSVTVSKTGTDTINGGTSFYIGPKNGAKFTVNASNNGYFTSDDGVLYKDASGNIGIGQAPGATGATGTLEIATASGTATRLLMSQASVTNYSWAIPASTDALTLLYGNSTERLRIDSGGRLLVSTTAHVHRAQEIFSVLGNAGFKSNNSGLPALNIVGSATNGYLQFFYTSGGSEVGSITTNGSSASFNTTSDYRLKEDVQDMSGALAKLSALRPVTYTWKNTGEAGQGFIAHELQAVFPDAVTGSKDAVDEEGHPVYQGVDTSFLVAALVSAVKELSSRVAALEAQ